MTAETLIDLLRFLVPVGLSVYALLSGRSREERKRMDETLKKLEMGAAQQDARMTGFQLELERVADDHARKHQDIEARMGEVKQLVIDVAGVKSDLKHMTDLLSEVRRDLRELLNKR